MQVEVPPLPFSTEKGKPRVEAPVEEIRLPLYSRDNPEALHHSLHLPLRHCSSDLTASIAQSQRKRAQPGR